MCDYSAKAAKQRAAAKDDKLVTRKLSSHTRGFVDAADMSTAVCILPGTELRFEKPIRIAGTGVIDRLFGGTTFPHTTARFRQVDKDNAHTHHDTLELPDGTTIKLTLLAEHQAATIIQLPVDPAQLEGQARRKAQAEQKRAQYV